jgi:hypothetical protein
LRSRRIFVMASFTVGEAGGRFGTGIPRTVVRVTRRST